MHRGRILAAFLGVVTTFAGTNALGQMRAPASNERPATEEAPSTRPDATQPAPTDSAPPQTHSQEKLARIWSNEPPLVRLARDKFGAELTETDAKFFAAVTANDWADLRPSSDTTYNSSEPSSWATSPKLKADRLVWLCTDATAAKLVPSRGVWLRGAPSKASSTSTARTSPSR